MKKMIFVLGFLTLGTFYAYSQQSFRGCPFAYKTKCGDFIEYMVYVEIDKDCSDKNTLEKRKQMEELLDKACNEKSIKDKELKIERASLDRKRLNFKYDEVIEEISDSIYLC